MYQCGSCEKVFRKLKAGSCQACGSGNFVKGYIDDKAAKRDIGAEVCAEMKKGRKIVFIDDAERIRRGDLLAGILGVKYIRREARYKTETALGIYEVAKRIIEEGR